MVTHSHCIHTHHDTNTTNIVIRGVSHVCPYTMSCSTTHAPRNNIQSVVYNSGAGIQGKEIVGPLHGYHSSSPACLCCFDWCASWGPTSMMWSRLESACTAYSRFWRLGWRRVALCLHLQDITCRWPLKFYTISNLHSVGVSLSTGNAMLWPIRNVCEAFGVLLKYNESKRKVERSDSIPCE